MNNSNINIITNNIFKYDQYTFYITPTVNILNITNIDILNKKKYVIYKYANGLLLKYLLIKFAKYNMIQIFDQQPHIDIILRFSTFLDKIKPINTISYNTQTILNNEIIENNVIKNKKNLYFNMLKYNPKIAFKHFSKTYLLKDIYKINNVYILRPFNNSGGGKNIFIVTSTKELINIKKKINVNNYIASEYITNPLLFKNKKFHLRVTFMITCIDSKISLSIFKHIRILQAKMPYKNKDFSNKDIHDSHVSSTDDDYLFSTEFKSNKNYNNIIRQIILVINECFSIVKPEIKLYPETKNSFQIFVSDFMITSEYIIKLLEINHGDIGYNFLNVKNYNIQQIFNKNFFKWIFIKTIVPIFFPKLILFIKDVIIINKYYNIIIKNNTLTINLNQNCNDVLLYYIIIINLLCPYIESQKITILDLTNNIIWNKSCNIIKCHYLISNNDNKYNLIISKNLQNIINFKKYIIIDNFIKHKYYKGVIKFNNTFLYIYKK